FTIEIENNNILNFLDIYEIKCNECDFVYIGTSNRNLKNRVNEHKNAIKNSYINKSVYQINNYMLPKT
ncbi:uncharacterized protein LOC128964937, partial [Oppia nitens]|uniref:uncharacterized protein LOC128964937 n=1 Tax=Oppia nitens TaxID=1686743 RepID=UPI0023DC2FB5